MNRRQIITLAAGVSVAAAAAGFTLTSGGAHHSALVTTAARATTTTTVARAVAAAAPTPSTTVERPTAKPAAAAAIQSDSNATTTTQPGVDNCVSVAGGPLCSQAKITYQAPAPTTPTTVAPPPPPTTSTTLPPYAFTCSESAQVVTVTNTGTQALTVQLWLGVPDSSPLIATLSVAAGQSQQKGVPVAQPVTARATTGIVEVCS